MTAPETPQLGDYRLLREIGRGGMGIVYEAEQIALGRRVALKILLHRKLQGDRLKQRFEREARAAARLHHTNIVPVFGVGEHDGLPYYVMQLVSGQGLDQVLAELQRFQQPGSPLESPVSPTAAPAADVARSLVTGRFPPAGGLVSPAEPERPPAAPVTIALSPGSADLPPAPTAATADAPPFAPGFAVLPELSSDSSRSGPRRSVYWRSVARIGVQVAGALEHAHKQGVIHRDIKPSNLLLDAQGTVWVTDFGLAKADDQEALTETGDILGTLRYLPPEAFDGKADARGDIYALGLTLYELVALRPAFEETDRHQLIKHVTTGEPARLGRLRPGVPRDLETIIHKAIDREPARRYPSAGALAADLQRFLDDVPIHARRASAPEHLVRWARRHPGLAAALSVLALFLVGGTIAATVAAVRFGALADEKEAARLDAVRAKHEAEDARGKAEQAGDEARRRGDAERWQRYRSTIAAAASALQLHNVASARRALEAAPPEHRNWEWLHFASQLDAARASRRGDTDVAWVMPLHGGGLWPGVRPQAQRLRLLDPVSDRQVGVLRGVAASTAYLVLSPAGTDVAAVSQDGTTVQLGDVRTGKSTALLQVARAKVNGFPVFSEDGKRIAALLTDGTGRVWDVATGRERTVVPARGGAPWEAFTLSADGRRVAFPVQDAIRVWDAESGKEVAALGPMKSVSVLALSQDGTRLASGGDYPDNDLRLWDVPTGRQRAVLSGHQNRIIAIAFSPDGTRVATASKDQTARLWDVSAGRLIAVLPGHTSDVAGVCFSPDGRRLASASWDHTLRLWDAMTGELLAALLGHTGEVRQAAFSRDGAYLLSTSSDKTMRLWDVRQVERQGGFRGHKSFVYDVAFSPDGTRLASAGWDGTVHLWDPTTGRQTDLLEHPSQIVASVSFSPDGRRLASVARANRVYLWDVAGGKQLASLRAPTQYWRVDTRAAFQPKGKLLAAGGVDGHIRLWDGAGGEPAAVLRGHEGCVTDVAFSTDGARLASAGEDRTVRLWDVAARKQVAVLRGHTELVHRVCWSADGRLLASASEDKTVRLWEAATYAARQPLAHGSIVYAVAFSPDGTRLAAGCLDNTIRLWDVAGREEVAELRGHRAYVHAVAFSPDGTRLASASGDFTVRVWDTVSPRVRARPPDAYVPPRGYVCYRASGPIQIDGKLDEDAWRAAPWTESFVDIEGALRLPPRFRTRAKMLWDDRYFYVAAELEEPHVWGTLTRHDSVIYHDNDFEVFIDPDGDNHNYAELEINALNTTWDLLLKKPYRDGGPALNEWEIPGLKTAVHVDGTLNDPRDTDRGWTVEIAIPWEALATLSAQPTPPRDGDQWRVNFSRVEWRHEVVAGKYRKVPDRREDNWVWSPQGVVDMHRPERWGYVQFATAPPGRVAFRPDPAGPAKHLLHRVYYAQRHYRNQHKRYAATLAELGLAGLAHDSLAGPIRLETSGDRFQATTAVRLPDGRVRQWRIREDSRIWPLGEATLPSH
jgi:WD40 repeat protein/serine/threonine protein kinase